MRFVSAIVALSVILGAFSMADAVGADENKFTSFIVSTLPPKPLDSAKASLIKNGMTLKTIVSILGSGWMPSNEGVGVIKWFFMDGRQLNILPHWDDRDDQSEIITYIGHNGLAHMWWTPSSVFTVKSASPDH